MRNDAVTGLSGAPAPWAEQAATGAPEQENTIAIPADPCKPRGVP